MRWESTVILILYQMIILIFINLFYEILNINIIDNLIGILTSCWLPCENISAMSRLSLLPLPVVDFFGYYISRTLRNGS